MSKKIVSLRGTSGSGKTSVAFAILKNYEHEEIVNDKGKTTGYKINVPELQHPLYLIGPYKTVCSGCDQIPTQQEAADRAVHYYQKGHVLMEGLLASAAGPKGAVTATIYETGDAVFAILDTPCEVCIERVKARRAARGDDREFNPKNTKDKWTQTMSTAKALHTLGYDVRAIDHTKAYEDVMDIFREAERD